MITLAKIETFGKFNGDIDGYSRSRGLGDTSGITDKDWWDIDRLCQAIFLIESGKAAKDFCDKIQQELLAITENEQTSVALKKLAMKGR